MDYYNEKILSVNHWTEELFSFKCTRNNDFKFKNGEFTLVGILLNKNPLTRAYSIISSENENFLEFLSIKIIDGELTSKLKFIKKNDDILIGKKSTGTLLINNLLDGKNLWLICSGTGIAPFISILNDVNLYNNYNNIILIHSSKDEDSLVYRYFILNKLIKKKIFLYKNNLYYYPTLTKGFFFNENRITEIINNKEIFLKLNINFFSNELDRFMICGSINMLNDIIYVLNFFNFLEGKFFKKAHYLIERAFLS